MRNGRYEFLDNIEKENLFFEAGEWNTILVLCSTKKNVASQCDVNGKLLVREQETAGKPAARRLFGFKRFATSGLNIGRPGKQIVDEAEICVIHMLGNFLK